MKTVTHRDLAYIIIDPWGNFWHESMARRRSDATAAVLKALIDDQTWLQLYRKGYRCVKVPLAAKVRR